METRSSHGLTYVLFAPADLGLYARPVPGGFMPIGPLAALRDSGALAALNGPMFDVCGGQDLPSGNAAYAYSVCDVLEYRHADRETSLDARGVHPLRGLTFSVKNGRVSAAHGDQGTGDVVIQTYPPLVEDGVSVATHSPNADIVWRSGLAVLRDGRMALVVGRMSMPAFAAALVEIGAWYAGYTDGGGSTALVLRDGPDGVIGSTEGRPVPSWLIVRRPRSIWGWVAAGVVGLLAWWNWRGAK